MLMSGAGNGSAKRGRTILGRETGVGGSWENETGGPTIKPAPRSAEIYVVLTAAVSLRCHTHTHTQVQQHKEERKTTTIMRTGNNENGE